MMNSYIKKIKTNVEIISTKKANHLLEGKYRSIYKGKSLDFEDLREYVIGDDPRTIDWKSSVKTDKLLVKQFIAEKKHNAFFIMDTNNSMLATTHKKEKKKDLAIVTFGSISYIVKNHGDAIGACFNTEDKPSIHLPSSNSKQIHKLIYDYDKNINLDSSKDLNTSINYVAKNINKRMIIFIITDLKGIDNLIEADLLVLLSKSNVLVINIEDDYLFGENGYDLQINKKIPKFLQDDTELYEEEVKSRKILLEKNSEKLNKLKIPMVSIGSDEEIVDKIIFLLERYKNGVIS